jgi:hypothetical protein
VELWENTQFKVVVHFVVGMALGPARATQDGKGIVMLEVPDTQENLEAENDHLAGPKSIPNFGGSVVWVMVDGELTRGLTPGPVS